MSSLPLASQRGTAASEPLRTGLALAVTMALFYALCTVVWVVAPRPFMGFMNSLFHGLDFTPLMKAMDFSWGGFVEAILVMSFWTFLAGVFFAWLHRQLRG